MMLPEHGNDPAGNGVESGNHKVTGLAPMLPERSDIAREARRRIHGYAVVVHNGGRWTRRLYLSLHSATQAVDRARDRGASPFLELVELVPAGDPR